MFLVIHYHGQQFHDRISWARDLLTEITLGLKTKLLEKSTHEKCVQFKTTLSFSSMKKTSNISSKDF